MNGNWNVLRRDEWPVHSNELIKFTNLRRHQQNINERHVTEAGSSIYYEHMTTQTLKILVNRMVEQMRDGYILHS